MRSYFNLIILLGCILLIPFTTQAQESISVSVLTYNTHLFGDLAQFKAVDLLPSATGIKDVRWKDEERKQRLKDYLATKPADIILLQELWSGAYANNIKHDERTENIYPNFYAKDAHHGEMNTAGLAALTAAGINIKDATFFNYISKCDKDGFDIQDKVSDKGFIQLTGEITSEFDSKIPDGQSIPLGIFFTHVVTNQSKHPKSADCCFEAIAQAIRDFRNANPNAIVFLTGDLNVQLSRKEKYDNYVKNKLLTPEVGMINAFDTRRELSGKTEAQDPGATIDAPKNRVAQHFDKGSDKTECVDYIFYAPSKNKSTSITLPSASDAYVITDLKTSDGIDVSDHYPVKAVFTVSSPLLRKPVSKYSWTDAGKIVVTDNPKVETEASLFLPKDAGVVVVGVAGKVSGNDFNTLALQVASIDANGNIGSTIVERKYGQAPHENHEVIGRVGPQEVVVGIGLRVSDSNLKTMALWGQRLNPATGKLEGPIKEYRFGKDANHKLEVQWVSSASDPRMLTSLGVRVSDNNMKGLIVGTGRIVPAAPNTLAPMLAENKLYQVSGEPEVFVIQNGVRRWITDMETFNALGLKWNNVQKISKQQLENLPAGPPLPSRKDGTLLQGNGPAVYVIKGSKRCWISSAEVFNKNGYKWDAIKKVSDQDLNSIPEGTAIK